MTRSALCTKAQTPGLVPIAIRAAAEKRWALQDMRVDAYSTSSTALDILANALPFPESRIADPANGLKIGLDFVDPSAFPSWLAEAEVLYASQTGRYRLCRVGDDPLVSIADIGMARLFSRDHHIQIVAVPNVESNAFVLAQALLAPLIGAALRAWGLLSLHACAVDWKGKAIVFPATSGSGKSTLALALVRAGFGLLSDDSPILRREPDGTLRLLAYPEPLRLMPDSLALFPETRMARTEASGVKRLLDPRQLYDAPYVASSSPAMIVMPRISEGATSAIRVAPHALAVTELVRGIAFGSTGASMTRDFPLLAQLVRGCRVYALETGTDFDRLPALLRGLLESG